MPKSSRHAGEHKEKINMSAATVVAYTHRMHMSDVGCRMSDINYSVQEDT